MAAALPKLSDMLTVSQSGGEVYTQPLALPHLNFFGITPLNWIDTLALFVKSIPSPSAESATSQADSSTSLMFWMFVIRSTKS